MKRKYPTIVFATQKSIGNRPKLRKQTTNKVSRVIKTKLLVLLERLAQTLVLKHLACSATCPTTALLNASSLAENHILKKRALFENRNCVTRAYKEMDTKQMIANKEPHVENVLKNTLRLYIRDQKTGLQKSHQTIPPINKAKIKVGVEIEVVTQCLK